jgi:transposase-like protein
MEMMNNPMVAAFADELSAHRYLESILWPHGPVCLRCGARGRVGQLDGATTRIGTYKCYACRKIFCITHGTIFERSHVPLHKWLQAIYLTDGGSTRIVPYHLARIVNVSFKTATTMIEKLAAASARDEAFGLSWRQRDDIVDRRRDGEATARSLAD